MESNVKPPAGESPYRRNMRLGEFQFRTGNYKAAMEAFQDALKENPEAGEPYGLIAACLMKEYRRTEKRDLSVQARQMARTYVEKSPDRAEAHRVYASVLRESGERKAEEHAKKAIELAPRDPENHVTLGLVYWNRRDFKNASRCFEEALKLSPHNVNALLNCGSYWFYIKGNREKARDFVTQALRLSPGNSIGLVLMGRLLMQDGKIKEAMEHARTVISRDPNNYEALYLIATIETRRNPFRGLGFRLALSHAQMRRRPIFYLVYPLFIVMLMLLFAAVRIPWILAWYVPFLYAIYLRFAIRSMKRYVRKNYLNPQNLKKDF